MDAKRGQLALKQDLERPLDLDHEGPNLDLYLVMPLVQKLLLFSLL